MGQESKGVFDARERSLGAYLIHTNIIFWNVIEEAFGFFVLILTVYAPKGTSETNQSKTLSSSASLVGTIIKLLGDSFQSVFYQE